MMWRSTRFIRAGVLVVAVVAAAGGPARRSAATGAGRFNQTAKTVVVPAVSLVNDRGEAVRLDELLATAEPVVLQFIFTSCPGVCPTLSATLAELGRRMPSARLVSISIDPEVDTPKRMAEYKARFGGTASWHFLTGSSADSIAVQQAFDSYRGEKMRHQPLTFVRPAKESAWIRFEGFAGVSELAEALAGTVR